jgi:hypothetical protein
MWASPAGKVGQSGPTRADVEDFFSGKDAVDSGVVRRSKVTAS